MEKSKNLNTKTGKFKCFRVSNGILESNDCNSINQKIKQNIKRWRANWMSRRKRKEKEAVYKVLKTIKLFKFLTFKENLRTTSGGLMKQNLRLDFTNPFVVGSQLF